SKCIGSEKAALEFKSIIEARLKLGQSLLPEEPHSGPILEDYYNKFREGYLETAVKDSTRRNYETCFRVHILPALGERRLGEVTRTHVKDLIASMVKKGLSRATIGITIRNLCTFTMQRTMASSERIPPREWPSSINRLMLSTKKLSL